MNPLRLFDRKPGTRKDQDRMIRTVCQECPLRCGLIAYVKNGAVVDIHGDDDHPVNRGRLCARGLAFIQGLDSPDRLTRPAFRKTLQENFSAIEDWEKALDGLAEHLRKIKDQCGPESIVIGCDPEADLDFALGAIHFANLLGTPHVYQPVDFEASRSDLLMPPYPGASCTTWGQSKTIVLVESDLAATHPIAFGWVLEAQQKGAKVIVADTRFTRTMSKADLALRIKPRTGNILGLALMKMALGEENHDAVTVGTRLNNPGKWQNSFEKLTWEEMENGLGVTAKEVRELKDLLIKYNPVTFITGKTLATLPGYGIWPTFITAMGWLESEDNASRWYPLAGTLPPLLSDRTLRAPDAANLLSARAVLCFGEGFSGMLSSLQAQDRGPDLVAWFGSFPHNPQRYAHLLFPAALWAEKSGACFSLNRTLQWSENIVEPNDGCKSGMDFWTGLAKRFGWQDALPWIGEDESADPRAFYQWVIANSPALKGCDPETLKDSAAAYFQTESGQTAEATAAPETLFSSSLNPEADAFPLVFQKIPLVSGSETVGRYWPWIEKLEEEEAVQLHPETAGALNIDNGETILLDGPAGTREGRAWISRMVPKWMVASPGSSRGDRVLIRKMDQTPEEALIRLKEILP